MAVLKLHQMTPWRKKKLGRIQAQLGASSPLVFIYELEAKFTVTLR